MSGPPQTFSAKSSAMSEDTSSSMSPQHIIRSPIVMQTTPIRSPKGKHDEQSAFQMLVQGIDQNIHIPLHTILIEVMKGMPAKDSPSFRCTKLGDSSYEAAIDLNVTGSRVTVEPNTGVATVLGEISSSEEMALLSAVKRSFHYLVTKHSVEVTDYSSRIVEGYDSKCVLGDVNSVGYNLDKVMGDWISVIDKIGMFHAELVRKYKIQAKHVLKTGADGIYSDAKDFVQLLFSKYHDKHNAIQLECNGIYGKRNKYIRDVEYQINKYRSKGYMQVIHFNDKDVLRCVLDLLALGPPEFSNKPVGRGEFRGEVIIQLPDIGHARCGGRTRFRGGVRYSAAEAEQHASYKALRYMESNLKLSVVDMNYPERVEEAGNHEFMLKLLRSIVGLAQSVLDVWSNMNESIKEGGYMYNGNRVSPLTADEVEALKFCKDGFAKIEVDCNVAYQDAMKNLKCLEKYKESGLYSDN